MTSTLVAFHAHPDDEALLTAGTMAKAASQGHRVVLVVATDGGAGLADASFEVGLTDHRRRETEASAAALGVARIVWLGYADSGSGPQPVADPPGRRCFVRVPLAEAAQALAAVLDEEGAEVLLSYDPAGGYGHRDHVRVHEVATAAAEMAANPPRVLEASAPREAFRLLAIVQPGWRAAYTPRRELTHEVDVSAQLPAKLASLQAHASQATGGVRTLRVLLALPARMQRRVLGTEYFRDPTAAPGARADDVWARVS